MRFVLQAHDRKGWYTEDVKNMDDVRDYLAHKVNSKVALIVDGKEVCYLPNGIVRSE